MNDRLKFRFHDKKNKIMVYADTDNESLPYYQDEIYTTLQTYNLSAIENLANNKDYIVMQCTGLKDKNGKLIYEGDILKINTWLDKIVPDDFEYRYENEKGFALYQIFFNQEKARFEAKCIKYTKEKPYRCFLLEYVPTNNEVIGNIYENKELLNE